MKQPVRFVFKKDIKEISYLSNQFELRKDRPFLCVQKSCFWILKKLQAFAKEEKIVGVETICFDVKDFMDNLFQQQESLLSCYGLEPKNVLMGTKEFAELARIKESRYYFSSILSTQINAQTIFNLKITVIPWMSGILVMPEI